MGYKMISYPEVRNKFINETSKELWNEDRSVSDDYLQWLENYVLTHQ